MRGVGSAADAGRDEPLVLLPGTLCDERLWRPVLDRLPCRPAIVKALAGEASTPAMASRLLAELPPRFALAGFSLGGIVALEMAAQAPKRLARLALVDTNARPDPAQNHGPRRDAVAQAARIGVAAYAKQHLLPAYAASGRSGEAEIAAVIMDMAGAADIDTFRAQSEMAIHRADSRPRLSGIAVPTLVLCGGEDRFCPVDRHREIADAVPGARLVVVPGVGHFAPLEAPEEVAAAMREWLTWGAAQPARITEGAGA